MRRVGGVAFIGGVVVQLAGLSLDGALHARDTDLAAREGAFALGNPGHLLFAVGLTLSVLGLISGLRTPVWRGRRSGVSALLPAVAVVAALGVAAGGLLVADRGRDRAGEAPAMVAHAHADEIDLSWEQLRAIDAALGEAKAATEKYRDVAVARADGYVQVTPVLYELAAHFVNQALLDAATLDLMRPPILLYDAAPDGGLDLVGAGWALPKRPGEPAQPALFAPLATWHEHDSFAGCVTARPDRRPVAVDLAEADCRAAGNVYFRERFWYVHVWLHRPSPEGVFSHRNSTID
jgi:hypothetical protein